MYLHMYTYLHNTKTGTTHTYVHTYKLISSKNWLFSYGKQELLENWLSSFTRTKMVLKLKSCALIVTALHLNKSFPQKHDSFFTYTRGKLVSRAERSLIWSYCTQYIILIYIILALFSATYQSFAKCDIAILETLN